ncbi:MAG: hypothetical protein LWW86_10450 [Micrococcales bacterium]|nr:hypothetical protein [Micrococcales bacterium]
MKQSLSRHLAASRRARRERALHAQRHEQLRTMLALQRDSARMQAR